MFFMENYIDTDRNLVKRTGTVCEHRSYGSVKVLEYWVLVLIALIDITTRFFKLYDLRPFIQKELPI